jgi:hypothetical protein
MDWDAWARRAEEAIDMRAASKRREEGSANRGVWREMFAPGATFCDPNTPLTEDIRTIARNTAAIFPDWRQEITRIRGGDDWAVFEWIGRATYHPPDGGPGAGAPIAMHGATVVEVNADGLVTSWRDYLDRKEPEEQIRRYARSTS